MSSNKNNKEMDTLVKSIIDDLGELEAGDKAGTIKIL
jgi:hypothetical protein